MPIAYLRGSMKRVLQPPLIILNFKAYEEATAEGGEALSEVAAKAGEESGVSVAVSVMATDIYRIARRVSIPVLAQHIDPVEPGGRTGHITALSVKKSGAVGSLVNHSEKRLLLADIEYIIKALRRHDLISVLCADTPTTSAAGASLGPDILAVEPPELIGTGISVSKARPEVVEDTVKLVRSVDRDVQILCGAGVSTGEDVRRAIELGADGVLLSSAFVKAKDPYRLLVEMCRAARDAYRGR